MSRLMRRGQRHIPSPLNFGRAPAAKIESLSPRRLHSPRQFITIVPSQATALPTPIQSILTTTVFQTVTSTASSTTSPSSTQPVQTQFPTATNGSIIQPIPTLQADQTTVGGGDTPTTVVNVAQGSNMTVIAGVAGAVSFSFLSVVLFFYVRKRTASNIGDNDKRSTLDVKRAQAIAGQLNRPYSSRARLG